MGDDIVEWVVGFFFLALTFVLVITAAFAVIPVVIIGGGGWLAWRAHNNSPATQTRRDMEALRSLYRTIELKLGRSITDRPSAAAIADEAAAAAERLTCRPVPRVAIPVLLRAAEELLRMPGGGPLPRFDDTALRASPQLRSELRQRLYELDEAHQYGAADPQPVFVAYLADILSEILLYLPSDASLDEEGAGGPFTTRLLDLIPANEAKELVSTIMVAPFTIDGGDVALRPLQQSTDARLAAIAGRSVEELVKNPRYLPKPVEDPRPPVAVARTFLAGSPFLPLLLQPVQYELPAEARLEHLHALAGSGHGKTQLLQALIASDLTALARHVEDPGRHAPRSVIVIDGQGDLIRTIARRAIFAPGGTLHGRLVLIDPADTLHPPALNLFDAGGRGRLNDLPPAAREALYNGTIELYVYLFSELLGAALTARQAALLRFLSELLLIIPNATLSTFLSVLDDDPEVLAHVSKLGATAQRFFETQYQSDEFKAPKRELTWRLWSLMANPAIAAMFESPKRKIDLGAELLRGAVVLVSTAKDTLKTEGARLFGRFWLALLAQAALERANVPAGRRVTTHAYLDEAHEIVDEKAEEILNQARKYRIGLAIAHQNLDQLRSVAIRASVAASSAIKLVGGLSRKDATAYAGELRTTPEHLLSAKKVDRVASEFIAYVRNHSGAALTLSVPFGQLERLPESDQVDWEALLEENRARYAYDPAASTAKKTPANEPAAASEEGDKAAETGNDAYDFKLGEPGEL